MSAYETAEELLARQVAEIESSANIVPVSVTNYQLKRALNTVPEDRNAVDVLVAGSSNQDIMDGWNHAQEFKRNHDLFKGVVAYLGWSNQKVDDYFRLASTFH